MDHGVAARREAARGKNMNCAEIEQLIRRSLPEAVVEVIDEVGDGNHFRATVVASQFVGKSLVQRHQMVYAALGDAMRDRIHALAIRAFTPEEWEQRILKPQDKSGGATDTSSS